MLWLSKNPLALFVSVCLVTTATLCILFWSQDVSNRNSADLHAKAKVATDAGFQNWSDMQAANQAGIASPKVWTDYKQKIAKEKKEQLPYDEALSRRICEKKIREEATYPSTVDIHGFIGYATGVNARGYRTIKQDFNAKNAYNLELGFQALCIISPRGDLDFSVTERKY